MNILKKEKEFFSINVFSASYRIDLEQKLFQTCKNICFEAIQNG